MFLDDRLDNLPFVRLSTNIQTSSFTSDQGHRLVSQNRRDSTRRRSIADAHFADGQQALSFRPRLRCEPESDFKCLRQLRIAHRRFMQHVASPIAHLAVQQSIDRIKMRVYADIDDVQLHTMELRQHIDSSAMSEKVQHHLPRHLAGISTDPLCSNSMVCRKDIHRLPQRLSEIFLSNRYYLCGNIFKHAEASKRLGQHIQMSMRTHKPQFARRLYGSDNFGDDRPARCVHPAFFV